MRSDIRDESLLSLLLNQTKLLPKAVESKAKTSSVPFFVLLNVKKNHLIYIKKKTATAAASMLISLASAWLTVPSCVSSLWLSADITTNVTT